MGLDLRSLGGPGCEEGSYLRLMDFFYHSTQGSNVLVAGAVRGVVRHDGPHHLRKTFLIIFHWDVAYNLPFICGFIVFRQAVTHSTPRVKFLHPFNVIEIHCGVNAGHLL